MIENPTQLQLLTLQGIIYAIVNVITNQYYIGKTTKTFNIRYSGGNWYKRTTSTYLKNAVDKYGIENFKIIILEFDIIDNKLLYKLEKEYGIKYNSLAPNGYNLRECGESKDSHLSNISKTKIANSCKDQNKGRKASLETKDKISKSLKLLFQNKENHPMYGKKRSKDSIDRQIKSKGCKEHVLLSKNGELVKFNNILKFARNNNLNPTSIRKVLEGTKGKCGEFSNPNNIFEYQTFKFISPTNTIVETRNLREFCNNHNLVESIMSLIHNKKRYSHRGWKKFCNSEEEKLELSKLKTRPTAFKIIYNDKETIVTNLSLFCKENNIPYWYIKDRNKNNNQFPNLQIIPIE